MMDTTNTHEPASIKAQLRALYQPHDGAVTLQKNIINFRSAWQSRMRTSSQYVLMVVMNATKNDTDVRVQSMNGAINKQVRMVLQGGGGPSIIEHWKRAAANEQSKRNLLFELVAKLDEGPQLLKHIQTLHRKGSYTAEQLLEVCSAQRNMSDIREKLNSLAEYIPPWQSSSVGVVLLQRQFTLHSNAFAVHHECCVPGGWTCVANRGFQATFGHFLGGGNEESQSSIPCFLMVVESANRYVEELYENQRWLPIKGWGGTLPFDRPSFTDRTGVAKDKMSVRLPRGWRWASGGWSRGDWLYSMSFNGVFSNHSTPTSVVRKRRWTRVMEVDSQYRRQSEQRNVCLSPVISNHSCESGDWEHAEDYLP